jgi:hypothetical protein
VWLMVRAVRACVMSFDGGITISSWLVVILVSWVSSSYVFVLVRIVQVLAGLKM